MFHRGLGWKERVIYWVIIFALALMLVLSRRAALPVAVFVNHEPVAWLPNARLAQWTLELARERLRQRYGRGVDFAEKVETDNLPLRSGQQIVSPSEAAQALLQRVTPAKRAFLIVVDGRPLLALPDKQEAQQALELVKAHLTPQKVTLVKPPRFKEKVSVRKGKILPGRIVPNAEAASQVLLSGLEPPRYHTVKAGEVAIRIASRYGINLQDLQQLNPGRDLNRLHIGDKLLIKRGKPLVTVVSIHQFVTKEPIPYEVERKLIPHLPGGSIVTKQRGKEGVKEIVWEVICENGVEVQRKVVKETVIKAPLAEVIWVGGGLGR